MSRMNRRRFLGIAGGAALAASVPWRLHGWRAGAAERLPGSLPFPERPAGMLHPDLVPELANIDHIIIVMMENHSFDNYFGMLPHRVPALNGLSVGHDVSVCPTPHCPLNGAKVSGS